MRIELEEKDLKNYKDMIDNYDQLVVKPFPVGMEMSIKVTITDSIKSDWLYRALFNPQSISGFDNLGIKFESINFNGADGLGLPQFINDLTKFVDDWKQLHPNNFITKETSGGYVR